MVAFTLVTGEQIDSTEAGSTFSAVQKSTKANFPTASSQGTESIPTIAVNPMRVAGPMAENMAKESLSAERVQSTKAFSITMKCFKTSPRGDNDLLLRQLFYEQ